MTNSDLLIYQSADGQIKIDVRLEDETVWLTQDQMAQLFGKAKSTINEHVKNIFAEQELEEPLVMKKFGISEFQQKAHHYYNLDVIISVGYRVRSQQGIRFRIWATQRLKEYIIKGFLLNDERFKSGHSMNYFAELQERIREIRLSERFFIKKSKTSIPQALIMIQRMQKPSRFSRLCRINSCGLSVGKQRQKLFIVGLMQHHP